MDAKAFPRLAKAVDQEREMAANPVRAAGTSIGIVYLSHRGRHVSAMTSKVLEAIIAADPAIYRAVVNLINELSNVQPAPNAGKEER